ncbi:unnamed protein product [Meganyctiphanes norvegica]|uniref:Riboflavin transporter n=1 Tax=Meganyctiphanes norvegica TaxID=48144 RepID=A0AAV2R549_MEGNR
MDAITIENEESSPLVSRRSTGTRSTPRSRIMSGRRPLVDILAAAFGIGAWISINGLWVELPLLVANLPEGWNLPSYLSVIIQIANLGPLAYTLASTLNPSLRPAKVIYAVLIVGCISSLLLPLLWQETTVIAGTQHSTALLALVGLLSLVDCTSSVLFMPYMAVWRQLYLPSYLVGEGLSGLIPGLVALVQGVGGNPTCRNVTDNSSTGWLLEQEELDPLFSVTDFFFFLLAMMITSFTAFIVLERLPNIQGERASTSTEDIIQASQSDANLVGVVIPTKKSSMSSGLYWTTLVGLGFVCMLTNGALPSIQSYSCGPYGNTAYHLAVTLSALANPVAAMLTMVLPRATTLVLAVLGSLGTAVSAYILTTAATSPTPPLVDTAAGEALVVIAWVVFSGVMSYVRVEVANKMRDEGDGQRALFWAGAFTQFGSAIGAITMFVLVNVYNLFTPYYPCS